MILKSGIGDGHFCSRSRLRFRRSHRLPPAGFPTLSLSYNNGIILTNVYLNKNPGAEVSWSPPVKIIRGVGFMRSLAFRGCRFYRVIRRTDSALKAKYNHCWTRSGSFPQVRFFFCVLNRPQCCGKSEDPVLSGTAIDFSFNNSGDWVFCAMHNVVASGGSIALGASYGGFRHRHAGRYKALALQAACYGNDCPP